MSIAHWPTASPPPLMTVMSSASTCVSRMTSTSADALAAVAASSSPPLSGGGATSCARRWRVQSPALVTSVGTSGRGTIDPTSSPSPENSKAVTYRSTPPL